jgi:molybdopterin-binding protein
MNSIPGMISKIEVGDRLSIITVDTGEADIQAIVVDTPESADYIRLGTAVHALIKETEIFIATDTEFSVSIRNKLPVEILDIEMGKVLSRLTLRFSGIEIFSIVPSSAVRDLSLKTSQKVMALVKINEVMLSHD